MKKYQAFSVSVQGNSHIMEGSLKEDAAGSDSSEYYDIAVVADGHGDKACFRSWIGSQYAVDICIQSLKQFAQTVAEEKYYDQLLRGKLNYALSRSVIGSWKEMVLQQLQDVPITEEEYAVSHKYEPIYRSGSRLEHIFGTTLIAALLTEDYLLVMHQGDGRCIVIHQSGLVDQPVPWDPDCVGNQTTSLCGENAIEACRFYTLDQKKDPVAAVILCTDGVEDSFGDMDAVDAYVAELVAEACEEGCEKLVEKLNAELPLLSRCGSRDDISIAAIIDFEAVKPYREQFHTMRKMAIYNTELRKAEEAFDSMYMKMTGLTKDYNKARTEFEADSAGLGKEKGILEKALATITGTLSENEKTMQQKKEAFEKLEAEYLEYREQYEQAECKVQCEKQRIEELRQQITEMQQAGVQKEEMTEIEDEYIPVYSQNDTDSESVEYEQEEQLLAAETVIGQSETAESE